MPRLNQNQQIQTLMMLAHGDNFSVSRVCGCHRNTIIRLRKHLQQTGGVADGRKPRRPRVTNPWTDRFIALMHLRCHFQTATSSARQYSISKQTVLRRLRQAWQPRQPIWGPHRRPYVGQVLTARHQAACLQWAQRHFFQRHGNIDVSLILLLPVILMHDNARPHVARICRQFLNRNNVNVLPWPAVSSDTNPTEHIWDYLGRKFRARGNIHNLRDLENALIQEWNDISQRRYQTLRKVNARSPCCLHH